MKMITQSGTIASSGFFTAGVQGSTVQVSDLLPFPAGNGLDFRDTLPWLMWLLGIWKLPISLKSILKESKKCLSTESRGGFMG